VYASTEIAYFGYIEGRQDQVSHHAFGSIPHHGVALLGYGEMCTYPAFNTLLQTCLQLCVSQGLGEHNSALCSLRELDVNPSREHLEAQCRMEVHIPTCRTQEAFSAVDSATLVNCSLFAFCVSPATYPSPSPGLILSHTPHRNELSTVRISRLIFFAADLDRYRKVT
jgi:hypothetical protein